MLSATLSAIHNVRFYLDLAAGARAAIEAGDFAAFKADFLAEYLRDDGGSGH